MMKKQECTIIKYFLKKNSKYQFMKKQLSSLIFLFVLGLTVSAKTKRVLFIGNSYIYVNNLPQMVKDVASSVGDTLIFDSYVVGGYRLQDHANDQTALNLIAAGNWDFVVLQEQSQMPSFPLSQVQSDVFPYAKKLDSLIHAANPCSETIFYMTWGRKNGDAGNCPGWPPVCTYLGMDSLLRERYLMMANANQANVSPVGPVWRYLRTNNASIELYQTDESHPSTAGTYAAACSFYSVIFRKNPTAITNNAGLSVQDAVAIRNAAKAIAYDSLLNWNVGKFDPKAIFQFQYQANGLVDFTNLSLNGIDYSWNFGDGNTDNVFQPSHTYNVSGNYLVTLTVNKCTYQDTISQWLTVSTNSIDEIKDNKIVVFPNPTNGVIEILGSNINNDFVSIIDLRGRKKILKTQFRNDKLFIDLSDYSSGVYLLELKTGNIFKRFIVQKN